MSYPIDDHDEDPSSWCRDEADGLSPGAVFGLTAGILVTGGVVVGVASCLLLAYMVVSAIEGIGPPGGPDSSAMPAENAKRHWEFTDRAVRTAEAELQAEEAKGPPSRDEQAIARRREAVEEARKERKAAEQQYRKLWGPNPPGLGPEGTAEKDRAGQ